MGKSVVPRDSRRLKKNGRKNPRGHRSYGGRLRETKRHTDDSKLGGGKEEATKGKGFPQKLENIKSRRGQPSLGRTTKKKKTCLAGWGRIKS